MRTMLIAAVLLLGTGCRKEQPAAPTAEQSTRLNEAEDLLNSMARNEEGPEDRAPGPSNQSD